MNKEGVFCDTRRRTAEGFEMTVAVNFLGRFLLTRFMLPLVLRAGGDGHARIVSVASAAAVYGRLRLHEGRAPYCTRRPPLSSRG